MPSVLILGGTGLVGSAIVRHLSDLNLIRSSDKYTLHFPSREEVDLDDKHAFKQLYSDLKPDFVIICAAKVGGIVDNSTYPADFILSNISIIYNVFNSVKDVYIETDFKPNRIIFMGSSCIYPKECQQPIYENDLMTGPLEPTNEGYAISKIVGVTLCKKMREQYNIDCVALMPCNMYGPNDTYHAQKSHVIPGMIKRLSESMDRSTFKVWGTGKPKREFMHVDDLARACSVIMNTKKCEYLLNVGSGEEISISELASIIAKEMGYKGKLIYRSDLPDGTMRKIMCSDRIRSLGWKPVIGIKKGIKTVVKEFVENNK